MNVEYIPEIGASILTIPTCECDTNKCSFQQTKTNRRQRHPLSIFFFFLDRFLVLTLFDDIVVGCCRRRHRLRIFFICKVMLKSEL